MNVRTLAMAAGLLLAACKPTSRPVPRYDDMPGKMAALASLSPWADGSPDRSDDHRSSGEHGSDRKVFLNWLTRYEDYEYNTQGDRNYIPFPVPSTIGDAIADERQFEKDEAGNHPPNKAERDPHTGWEKLPEPTLGMVERTPAQTPAPASSSRGTDGQWQAVADQAIVVRDAKGQKRCCLTVGDLARKYIGEGYDMHAAIEGDQLVMYADKDCGTDRQSVIRVVLEGESAVGDGWHVLRIEDNGEVTTDRSAPWPESPDARMVGNFKLRY